MGLGSKSPTKKREIPEIIDIKKFKNKMAIVLNS